MGVEVDSEASAALAPSELRYLVLAAQREGNRALNRRLSGLRLTPSQCEILLVLHEYGPLTLKDLGEYIVCETGSPSRIVDTLVRRGFVVRKTSDFDRRAVEVDLSQDGAAVIPTLHAIDEGMSTLPPNVDSAQLAGLVSTLRSYLHGSPSATVLDRRFEGKREPIRN